eukprot:gene9835-4122_t
MDAASSSEEYVTWVLRTQAAAAAASTRVSRLAQLSPHAVLGALMRGGPPAVRGAVMRALLRVAEEAGYGADDARAGAGEAAGREA